MAVLISEIELDSPAFHAGIQQGDTLLTINTHQINDVLDYRFYMMEETLDLELLNAKSEVYTKNIQKEEYQELGLLFDTYLMDQQHSCKNKCVFCFIDQMPPNMRDTLYFKDDDDRMSFLFGNYITLTNLTEKDLQRIIDMHISPINVSVHTTNPELRVKIMKNPHSGEVLSWLPRLVEAGIHLNTQLVLCPGWNDGEELKRSLSDLCQLAPGLQSVSCVPVGLTRYRENLEKMRPFAPQEAGEIIDTIDSFGDAMLKQHGERICLPGDEFFLLANRPIPSPEYYGDFLQLENGVGLIALLEQEFSQALALEDPRCVGRTISLATGHLAVPLMRKLAKQAEETFPGLSIHIYEITNHFFGEKITVAGLITGQDLIHQLKGKELGEELLFPAVMLRHQRDLFLDDTTIPQLSEQLGVAVKPVENDGFALLDAFLGLDTETVIS